MSSLYSQKTIKIKTPGKLFLSGEWGVLEPHNSCLILPVNKFVKAEIYPSSEIIINAPDIDLKDIHASLDKTKLIIKKDLSSQKKEKFLFAKTAIETALKYLSEKNIEIKNFELSIDSEISKIKLKDGSFTKIGLGSSAATAVAIISAILKFHDFEVESFQAKEIIFKLSSIAHYIAQNKVGSCADVAASTYAQPLIYKKFDDAWFTQEIEKNKQLTDLVEKPWPGRGLSAIRLYGVHVFGQ